METSLLIKKQPRRTEANNRTIARPVIRSKKRRLSIKPFVLKVVIGTCYTFAILSLFELVSSQVAYGFSDVSTLKISARVMPASAQATTSKTKTGAKVGLPVRLKIPRIKVNAAIRYVGITKDGSMGVPKLARDTAWYMLGPKPGEKGSAVIAGHINWLYGATGVFANLSSLKVGDLLTVQDEFGTSTTFVVREKRMYGLKEDASDVFLSHDGKAHLNLVTCSGVWDRIIKKYTKRLVVFTDKVTE